MPDSINPLNNVTVPIPQSTIDAEKAKAANVMGKDTFLKLLVAQMKYQDPSKPADSSQLMAQSAQLSMVEKLEQLSTQTTAMLNATNSSAATGMLGRKIVASDSTGKDITGIVTGMRITTEGPVLKIGNAEVAYDQVKEVDQPA